MKARDIGHTRVVVGDDVALVGDLAGGPDALARIVRIRIDVRCCAARPTTCRPYERIIVANADQLVIVTALADPEPAWDGRLSRRRLRRRPRPAAPHSARPTWSTRPTSSRTPLGSRTSSPRAWAAGGQVDTLREARGSGLGVRRALRSRQEHPGPTPWCGSASPARRGSSTTPRAEVGTHLDERGGPAAARRPRRLGHRHARHPVVRARTSTSTTSSTTSPDLAAGTGDCPRGCTHDEPECGLGLGSREGIAGPAEGVSRLESLRRLLRTQPRRTLAVGTGLAPSAGVTRKHSRQGRTAAPCRTMMGLCQRRSS